MTTEILCCYFERPCDSTCMAFEGTDDKNERPICRRLTSKEYAAYFIQEGLEHLAMSVLGPEAISSMCTCDDCKSKQEEKETENNTPNGHSALYS